jgi:hypothetical protein
LDEMVKIQILARNLNFRHNNRYLNLRKIRILNGCLV